MLWYGRVNNGFHRVNHAAVAVGTKIYSFGGYTDCSYTPDLMDVHLFNTETFCWSPVHYFTKCEGSVPPQLFGHSAVEYLNKIYIWGGQSICQESDDSNPILYCFDCETHEWSLPKVSGNAPDGIYGHTANVINNYMFIIGGGGIHAMMPMDTIFRLNLQTFRWEKLTTRGSSPTQRDFHSASVIGSKIYIFGGRGGYFEEAIYSDEITSLDTDGMVWDTPFTLFKPLGRRSHSAVVYRNEIYIFFGYNPSWSHYFNQICKFNPVSCEWKEITPKYNETNQCTPCGRRRQCCILVGDSVYAFGGSSPSCMGDDLCYHNPKHNSADLPLKDHSDLYIFDFFPTLQHLCLFEVVQQRLDYTTLPMALQHEIRRLMSEESTPNTFCRCSRVL